MFRRIPASQLLDVDAKRICIIKPSAFGDVVQTLPLLPILRERFPSATISWVINKELSELLSGHPNLDAIIPFERRGGWKSWMGTLGRMRSGQFDLVFDLQGLFRTSAMMACSGAPLRVGLQTAREGAQFVANCILPDTGRQVPAHAGYWRVAESLGMGDRKREATIFVPQQDEQWAGKELGRLAGPVLAVHAGARWKTKRWPVQKFAIVCARAVREFGFSLALIGSKAESSVADELIGWLREMVPTAPILNLTGKTTLKQLTATLSASDALLTNDSGPMHLAAALGTPVVGLFTCTSPQRSGPPGQSHELVSTQLACAASYKKQCPLHGQHHMACMDELATNRVSAALQRLVSKNGIARRAA